MIPTDREPTRPPNRLGPAGAGHPNQHRASTGGPDTAPNKSGEGHDGGDGGGPSGAPPQNGSGFTATRRALLGAASGLVLAPRFGAAQTPVPEPKRGGTMTIMFFQEPPSLVSLVNTNSLTCSAKVTEGLLWYDHDMQPHPQLATEWTISPDKLTYTFRLRQGVKWHDGQDFTSADVAASLAILRKSHPRGRGTFLHVAEVLTPDDHTVVLNLDKPIPYLIKGFAAAESPIVPKHIYDGTDPFTNRNNSAPIGTGPFRFKEYARGDHVVYERNPDYWDSPRPYLDQLVVKFIPDAASRSAALESGEVDLGYRTPVAYSDLDRLRAAGKLAFETKGYEYSNNVLALEFNLDNPNFAKLPVRQAVSHALNRAAICKTVYYGTFEPCAAPIAPFMKEYHSPDPSPYGFDVGKAEKLLDEAGCPRGGDGTRFHMIFDASPAVEEARRLGDFIRASLARVGIAVEVRTSDFGTYAKRVYTDRDFDVCCTSFSNLFDPTVGVMRIYWSKNIVKGVPFSNTSYYRDPRVDELLETAAIEPDPEKRRAEFMEFQQIVMRDAPDFNVGVPQWITIYNKRVQGHTITADGIEGNLAHAYIAS
jgi:peptide/nickel transport system substrate-binding protein